MQGLNSNFTDNSKGIGVSSNFTKGGGDNGDDNELFMGGIPTTMVESKVKQLCESFGLLKKFMLHKDPNNPYQNKGYCFFEYVDPRATEKAIKHLHNMEFKDKCLKV